MAKCKYWTYRHYKKKGAPYCRKNNDFIEWSDCDNCNQKEYKEVKPIKKKSSKLQKAENQRKSILQSDTSKCYVCHRKLELDQHEAIGGMNRLTSIKWDLIFYLCRTCHSELDLDQSKKEELQILAQEKFIELYGYEKFMEEFKMDYIAKANNRRENKKWKKE